MNYVFLPLILVLLASCGGSGGSESSIASSTVNNQLNNSGENGPINDAEDQANPSSAGGSLTKLLDGNFDLIATATDSSIALELSLGSCANYKGRVSIYNGKLFGWFDGNYRVNANIATDGALKADVLSGTSRRGGVIGTFSSSGGNGTWEISGTCRGNWTAIRKPTTQLLVGEAFTLDEGEFPAMLRVRFTPSKSHSQAQVLCSSSEGIVDTTGYANTYDSEIHYNGYALTTTGYRLDIDIDIDTDTGEIDGRYKYDPLGIDGAFVGDIYYAETQRLYASTNQSYDNGCQGIWHVTAADVEFPTRPTTEIADSEVIDTEDNENADADADADANDVDIPVFIGQVHSSEIPGCKQAKERILLNVNPLMSQSDVLATVGRPMTIDGIYGTKWNYGKASIDFSYAEGKATVVEGYNAGTIECADTPDDIQLIELANQMASQLPSVDYTDEVPSCYDAATRIVAWVLPDMNQNQIRRLVGKPLSIGGIYGTKWEYGDSGITVRFRYDRTEGIPVATVVEGYVIRNISLCLSNISQ
ncbi:MAG: hypothetical protein AB8B87_26225 [Granulosicoccus sp.]